MARKARKDPSGCAWQIAIFAITCTILLATYVAFSLIVWDGSSP